MKILTQVTNSILIIVFFTSTFLSAQISDISQKKIQFSVGNSKNSETYLPRSFSLSFNKPIWEVSQTITAEKDKSQENRKYLIALDFDRIPDSLLKVFIDYNKEFSGTIITTDSSTNQVQRKIRYVGAVLDSMSEQQSADYSSSYIYISCRELIIDDVQLK